MDGSCLCYGSFEGEILEGVEGVVMYEDADGTLGWEEVCCVVNRFVQTAGSPAGLVRRWFVVRQHAPASMRGQMVGGIPPARDSDNRRRGGLSAGGFLASRRDTRGRRVAP